MYTHNTQHTHTHIYICVCVCVCVIFARKQSYLYFVEQNIGPFNFVEYSRITFNSSNLDMPVTMMFKLSGEDRNAFKSL